MPEVTIALTSLLLVMQAPATGIGSGPHGAGAPSDMPVSSGADAPGSPHSVSRNPAALRKVIAERVAAYRAAIAARRAEAEAGAAAARAGQAGADAAAIRSALEADMQGWRGSCNIAGDEWRANAGQWLGPVESLTAAQWAARRAAWFASRDAWIAAQTARKK